MSVCSECDGTSKFLLVTKGELTLGKCTTISDSKEYCLDKELNRIYESTFIRATI